MLNKIFKSALFLSFMSAPAYSRDVIPDHLKSLTDVIELEESTFEDIDIYYEKRNHHKLLVVKNTLRDLDRFIPVDKKNSCREMKLEIFLIPEHVLNDRDVMHFISWDSWGNLDVWGAYDSFHRPKVGEMYIDVDAVDSRVSMSIVHEWFHHHQTSNCQRRSEVGLHKLRDNFCATSSMC